MTTWTKGLRVMATAACPKCYRRDCPKAMDRRRKCAAKQ